MIASPHRVAQILAMPDSRTVLVVDDSEVVRTLFADLLKIWGYAALSASNEAQALAIAEQHPVDAVFTDLQLPGGSGLDLCRQFRAIAQERGKPLPVWLMSGSDHKDYTVEAGEAGAIGFVRKPFNPADVSRRLSEAMAQK
jgi:CheY-like chemotaxis protein